MRQRKEWGGLSDSDGRGAAYRFDNGSTWASTDRETTRCFREVIMDHIHPIFGKRTEEIADEVYRDFGGFHGRTFQRNLAWLIEVGCVRVDEEYCLESGHMVPVYFRANREIPSIIQVPYCRECGMSGTDSKSHPQHDARQYPSDRRKPIPSGRILASERFR
jgi:hypothetical protein